MKYIKSKKISKQKYLLTLEVSEYDLLMLEDLATTYAPFELYQLTKENYDSGLEILEYTDQYRKWLLKTWRTFWMLWRTHDKF